MPQRYLVVGNFAKSVVTLVCIFGLYKKNPYTGNFYLRDDEPLCFKITSARFIFRINQLLLIKVGEKGGWEDVFGGWCNKPQVET